MRGYDDTDALTGGGAPGTSGAEGDRSETVQRILESLSPGRRGVRGIALFALVVTVLAGYVVWRGRTQTEPIPQLGASASTGISGSATELVVAVTGRVHRPGLVHLTPGARVADAIAAAGGVLPDTDVAGVGLARRVADGESIVVGSPASGAPAPPGPASASVASGSGVVNLNTATSTQLQTLPGVGPVLAQRIIDYRVAHGAFASVNDLRKVEGIGDTRFRRLRELVAT